MGKEDSFVFYTKYAGALDRLSRPVRGDILMACISYVSEGALPRFDDPAADMLFEVIRGDIDNDKRKYEEVCERNRSNANMRWHAVASDGIRAHAVDADRIGKDKDRIGKDMDVYSTPTSLSIAPDRKDEMKRQISDLTKITLQRMGGTS